MSSACHRPDDRVAARIIIRAPTGTGASWAHVMTGDVPIRRNGLKNKRYLIALLAVLAIVVAACSPSGGETTTTEGGGATTTEAMTSTTEAMTSTTEAMTGDITVGVSWNNYNEERWAKWDEPAIKAALDAAGATYISTDAGSSAGS